MPTQTADGFPPAVFLYSEGLAKPKLVLTGNIPSGVFHPPLHKASFVEANRSSMGQFPYSNADQNRNERTKIEMKRAGGILRPLLYLENDGLGP